MKPSDAMIPLVEAEGLSVGINTLDCILYKSEHDNCFGCQYEKGCTRLAELMAEAAERAIQKRFEG